MLNNNAEKIRTVSWYIITRSGMSALLAAGYRSRRVDIHDPRTRYPVPPMFPCTLYPSVSLHQRRRLLFALGEPFRCRPSWPPRILSLMLSIDRTWASHPTALVLMSDVPRNTLPKITSPPHAYIWFKTNSEKSEWGWWGEVVVVLRRGAIGTRDGWSGLGVLKGGCFQECGETSWLKHSRESTKDNHQLARKES